MSEKRAWCALSPASDDSPGTEEKRACMVDTCDESTIITDPLSSTHLDLPSPVTTRERTDTPTPPVSMALPTSTPAPAATSTRPSSVREEVISALTDPLVIAMISSITNKVIERMDARFEALHTQLREKDKRIEELERKVDTLEQYTRRNSVRIVGIPEVKGENTDDIVTAAAKTIGVNIDTKDIDRSHRVGPPTTSPRPLIVKFATYRTKSAIMRARVQLKRKTAADVLVHLSKDKVPGSDRKVFINEDLTSTRARLAADARRRKKDGKIEDTWTRDGDVFIKKADRTRKIFSVGELDNLS